MRYLLILFVLCASPTLAQPVVESSAETYIGASDTSIVVSKPTGTADGDLLVAVSLHSPARTISSTGFTEISDITSAEVSRATVLYKVAGASEPANYTFTFNNIAVGGVSLIRISGAADPAANAIETATNTGNGGTITSPAITPSDDDSLIIHTLGIQRSSVTITVPSGETTIKNTSDGLYNNAQSYITGDAVESPAVTWTASREWAAHSLAIAPSSSPSGPAINPISSSIPGSSLDPIRTTIP